MDLLRSLPPLALVVALLGGCQSPTDGADTSASSDREPAAEQPDDQQPDGQSPDDPETDDAGPSSAADDPPSVPPLHPAIDDLDESSVAITTDGGEVALRVKVAANDEERRRGLMEVEDLPEGTGMLFLFEDDRTGGFWMRNTLVPLDIAYVRADGSIAAILAMEPCTAEAASDCSVYTPPEPYRTALEVPQGWFDAQGIEEGDLVEWSEPAPPTDTT